MSLKKVIAFFFFMLLGLHYSSRRDTADDERIVTGSQLTGQYGQRR